MVDRELINLLIRSPDKGLQAVMKHYMGIVHTVVAGRLGDAGSRLDVEECVSEVFVELYQKRDSIDPNKGSLKAYLCAIARHRAVDRYRQLLRESAALSLDEEGAAHLAANSSSPEEEALAAESRRALLQAVADLGEPDHEIILRKFYLQEPSKSIAARLNMTVSAVDTRTHRALAKLREQLKEVIV